MRTLALSLLLAALSVPVFTAQDSQLMILDTHGQRYDRIVGLYVGCESSQASRWACSRRLIEKGYVKLPFRVELIDKRGFHVRHFANIPLRSIKCFDCDLPESWYVLWQ